MERRPSAANVSISDLPFHRRHRTMEPEAAISPSELFQLLKRFHLP
jgi:hypothetical protein